MKLKRRICWYNINATNLDIIIKMKILASGDLHGDTRLAQSLAEKAEKEKLKELDSLKTKFYTNITHEFRSPLTLIMGPTEKLLSRDEIRNNVRIREELELIYRNERRLFKLINQLLEVRRVETGNLVLAVAEDRVLA